MAQDGVVGPTPQKLHENYSAIRETLAKIATDCDEKPDTRRDAAALVGKLDTLETVMMGILWDRVLGRFKAVSVHLQKLHGLSNCCWPFAVVTLLCWHTSRPVAELEKSARTVSVTQSYQYDVRRVRKRKQHSLMVVGVFRLRHIMSSSIGSCHAYQNGSSHTRTSMISLVFCSIREGLYRK